MIQIEKDRTVQIPKALYTQLKTQVEKVYEIHQKDLAEKYDGAFCLTGLKINTNMQPRSLSGNGFSLQLCQPPA